MQNFILNVSHNKKRYIVLYLIPLLFTVGCKVKTPPNSEELQKEAITHFVLPSTWKGANNDLIDTTNLSNNWLNSFNDPRLDALVSEALQYNSDLKISSSRIDQADGYYNLSKAALRPGLNILGRGSSKYGEGFSSGLNGVMLSASWEFDIWGKLRNARQASKEMVSASQEDYNFAKLSLAASVTKSWYNATEIYLEAQLAKEMIKTNNTLLDLAKKRLDVGIGNEIDYEVSKANLNSTKEALEKLELAYSNQLRALEVLVGRYPAAEIEVNKALITITGTIPSGIPIQILERRPDLIAVERRYDAAFHRVEEAKASKLPNINLGLSFGAITSTILQLQSDFSNPVGGFNATAGVPLYQGGAVNASVQIRTAEQQQVVAEYASTVLKALNDVETALNASTTLEEREKYLLLSVDSNQKAFKLEQQLYEVGKTDMRTVSQQQLSLYASKITLLRVQSEKISQRVNLYLALGGNL